MRALITYLSFHACAFVDEDNDDNDDARTKTAAASADTGAGSSMLNACESLWWNVKKRREKTMVEPPINELSFGCHSNECQLPTVVGPSCACLHILLAAYQMLIDK